MLIDDLLATIKPSSQVSEEEIEQDWFLALLKVEVSLKKHKRLVAKPKFGLPPLTMREEQDLLLPGAVYKRRSLF